MYAFTVTMSFSVKPVIALTESPGMDMVFVEPTSEERIKDESPNISKSFVPTFAQI